MFKANVVIGIAERVPFDVESSNPYVWIIHVWHPNPDIVIRLFHKTTKAEDVSVDVVISTANGDVSGRGIWMSDSRNGVLDITAGECRELHLLSHHPGASDVTFELQHDILTPRPLPGVLSMYGRYIVTITAKGSKGRGDTRTFEVVRNGSKVDVRRVDNFK